MLTFQRFLRAFWSAQRQNRTADTGIFNRLRSFENAQQTGTFRDPRGLYVGRLGNHESVGFLAITTGGDE